MILEEHAILKCNYGNRHFWPEGYFGSTVELNKNTKLLNKRSMKEYKDPFMGNK